VSKRLRIAIYYNVGWGGGRRWLYECVSRLSAYHDVDLFSIDREPEQPHYPDVGEFAEHSVDMPFKDLPRLPGALKAFNAPLILADLIRFNSASRRMARRIDAGKYDLLFASIGGFTEAPLVLRHAKTPSMYYCHEPMRNLYEPVLPREYDRKSIPGRLRGLWNVVFYGSIVRRWDREGTRRANFVLTNSKYCCEHTFRSYGVRSQVNYPGVNVDEFQPGSLPRERFVLTVGQLMPFKGFDWTVRAIGAIPADKRPKLVLVCNKSFAAEQQYVEEVARECGVTLEIREHIPDTELKRLYQTASALLYTPHIEPFGLAAIEAMASGTPVVAVREGGPAETVVDGVSGFLCERDPAQLGAAVLRLLDDSELRETMGRAAREQAVALWSWDRSVAQLQSLMTNAAERLHTSRDDSRANDPLDITDTAVARRRA
jgi:glycosyltransferase involved in cell wall biosynthesis